MDDTNAVKRTIRPTAAIWPLPPPGIERRMRNDRYGDGPSRRPAGESMATSRPPPPPLSVLAKVNAVFCFLFRFFLCLCVYVLRACVCVGAFPLRLPSFPELAWSPSIIAPAHGVSFVLCVFSSAGFFAFHSTGSECVLRGVDPSITSPLRRLTVGFYRVLSGFSKPSALGRTAFFSLGYHAIDSSVSFFFFFACV